MSDLFSAIFDFKVRMISSVAAPQPTSLTLRKFPPEIRDMIYKLTLVGSWKGKMPAFIITLRGDQELYHEALQVLYETNRFTLTRRNRRMSNVRLLPGMTGKCPEHWDLGETSFKSYKTIRRVSLNLPSINTAYFSSPIFPP
jgi:hypothetical protein